MRECIKILQSSPFVSRSHLTTVFMAAFEKVLYPWPTAVTGVVAALPPRRGGDCILEFFDLRWRKLLKLRLNCCFVCWDEVNNLYVHDPLVQRRWYTVQDRDKELKSKTSGSKDRYARGKSIITNRRSSQRATSAAIRAVFGLQGSAELRRLKPSPLCTNVFDPILKAEYRDKHRLEHPW